MLSYRSDYSILTSVWTAENRRKFYEALKIYPRVSIHSNKLIAKYIGNGVHPNHVAHLKRCLLRERNRLLRDQD